MAANGTLFDAPGQQPAPSNGGNEERRIQPRGLGATQPAPSTQSTSAPETPPESDQVGSPLFFHQ